MSRTYIVRANNNPDFGTFEFSSADEAARFLNGFGYKAILAWGLYCEGEVL